MRHPMHPKKRISEGIKNNHIDAYKSHQQPLVSVVRKSWISERQPATTKAGTDGTPETDATTFLYQPSWDASRVPTGNNAPETVEVRATEEEELFAWAKDLSLDRFLLSEWDHVVMSEPTSSRAP